MHKHTLCLGEQNSPCCQHFINRTLMFECTTPTPTPTAPLHSFGIQPSPQPFIVLPQGWHQPGRQETWAAVFSAMPAWALEILLSLVAHWERTWGYTWAIPSVSKITLRVLITPYWGLNDLRAGVQSNRPKRSPQACTDVKMLLTEKEGSVTDPGFPFIISGCPLRGWPGRWNCRTSCG